MIISRLHLIADNVYLRTRCDVLASSSMINMVSAFERLQANCLERRHSSFIASIDSNKLFNFTSRIRLFTLLQIIYRHLELLTFIISFHNDTKGVVQRNGSSSDSFKIISFVKQSYILASTPSGIFFSLLSQHSFGKTRNDIFLTPLAMEVSPSLQTPVESQSLQGPYKTDNATMTAHTWGALQRKNQSL